MSRDLHPPKKKPKRVLAVRMLAARLAWLDGGLRWHAGRAAWEQPDGTLFAPGPSDLSRAQRALNKLAQYPISAELAFGDAEAWRAARRERLELAKRLAACAVADAADLERRAAARVPAALRTMAGLVVAEALCLDPVVPSPTRALRAADGAGADLLSGLVANAALPLAARALAALALGSVPPAGRPPHLLAPDSPWLRRALACGRDHGLPEEAALVAALLADARGPALVSELLRLLRAPASDVPLALKPALLRALLADGAPAERVVALARAAVDTTGLAARLLRARDDLPDRPTDERLARAEQRRTELRAFQGELSHFVAALAASSRDPEAVRLAVRLIGLLLDLGPLGPALMAAVRTVLHAVGDIEPKLRRTYLELLVECHAALWQGARWPEGDEPDASLETQTRRDRRRKRQDERFGASLQQAWARGGKPVSTLLHLTGNSALVAEALDLGVASALARCGWPDAGRYRLYLQLWREYGRDVSEHHWRASSLLSAFRDGPSASRAVRAISRALAPAEPGVRRHLFEAVGETLAPDRDAARASEMLVKHLPAIRDAVAASGVETHPDYCLCGALMDAALDLERAAPEHAAGWLAWLLVEVPRALTWAAPRWEKLEALRTGVQVGVALADGDTRLLQAVVRAAMKRRFRHERDRLQAGLDCVRRRGLPRAALALLFAEQPGRAEDLLARLALAARIGPEGMGALSDTGEAPAAQEDAADALPSELAASADADGWRGLLDLAPELAPAAVAYVRASRAMGSSDSLPNAVRQALEYPRRLREQVAWLEGAGRGAEGAEGRAVRLRARLEDADGLRASIRKDVAAKIDRAAFNAQVAAIEAQVADCFRARLARMAGDVPDNLAMDDDLLNATHLTVDITANRRLLRRLLRAHLTGDAGWRERIPANAEFLAGLRARGVDPGAWLAAHPCRYRCDAAAGGSIRLHLETEPIRILQMGNYFDTCLSFGGLNAFSTVANACELNKRVIYATDGAGRVVGRKLIGLDAQGRLIGFRTYTSLTDRAGNEALYAIFRRYAARFADRCGLELADIGTVPKLFAEDWYDDGVVPWGEAPPARLDERGKKRGPRAELLPAPEPVPMGYGSMHRRSKATYPAGGDLSLNPRNCDASIPGDRRP